MTLKILFLGWVFYIIQIEKYSCNNKREAECREEYWRVELNAQLNMIKAKEDEKFISQALIDILTITVPLIISLISGGLMGIINAYFIGHIGTKE
jgi:hypothetical protein